MSSVESLRNQVRQEAVQPARPTSERIGKLADDCDRLKKAARAVLNGAGGSVGSVVPDELSKAQEALEIAKKSLLEAGTRADLYGKSLP